MDQNIFYDEMHNKINVMHNILIDIKDGTSDLELINELFRAIHTIKGAADLLYLEDIVSICHKSEDLLTLVRESKLTLDHNMAHLFVEIKDFLKLILDDTFQGLNDAEMIDNLSVYFKKKIDSFCIKSVVILSEENIFYAKDRYTKHGYNIDQISTLIDTIDFIDKTETSLIFIDVDSLDDNDFDLLKEIRMNSDRKYIPIVLIVPKNYSKLVILGKFLGAKAWIEKPIKDDKIFEIVKKILG